MAYTGMKCCFIMHFLSKSLPLATSEPLINLQIDKTYRLKEMANICLRMELKKDPEVTIAAKIITQQQHGFFYI